MKPSESVEALRERECGADYEEEREYLVAEVARTEREYKAALAVTVMIALLVLALIVLAGSVAPVGH